jgi:hypothetical protein
MPAIAITTRARRECEHAFVTQDGTRAMPRNYSETPMGLALVAADAQGVAIVARDAYGVGNQGADISPARWSREHGSRKPPEECAWPAGNKNQFGQPLDIPATTPWVFCPGMVCDHVAIRLKQTDWLNKLGLEEMADRQVRSGMQTHLAGLDGGDQMANRELGPMCVALQLRARGWIGHVTATVKHLCETRDIEVNWPGLDDVEVVDFSLRVMPIISFGEPLFDNTLEPYNLGYSAEDLTNLLCLCEIEIM